MQDQTHNPLWTTVRKRRTKKKKAELCTIFFRQNRISWFLKLYSCMLTGEFKKLLSLGIKIMTLISRWEMLVSGAERKYFDISLQILTTTWHKSLGWDNTKLTSMSWKIIDWEIHHKSFIGDLFFCGLLKGQTQSFLKHFGSSTGTTKNKAPSM